MSENVVSRAQIRSQEAFRRLLFTVWGAFIVSTLALFAVAYLVIAQGAALDPAFAAKEQATFAVAAFVLALGSNILLRHFLYLPLARGVLESVSAEGQRRIMLSCIVAWAMTEGMAILGLVLALFAGDFQVFLPFGGGGLLLLLLRKPPRSAFK